MSLGSVGEVTFSWLEVEIFSCVYIGSLISRFVSSFLSLAVYGKRRNAG